MGRLHIEVRDNQHQLLHLLFDDVYHCCRQTLPCHVYIFPRTLLLPSLHNKRKQTRWNFKCVALPHLKSVRCEAYGLMCRQWEDINFYSMSLSLFFIISDIIALPQPDVILTWSVVICVLKRNETPKLIWRLRVAEIILKYYIISNFLQIN